MALLSHKGLVPQSPVTCTPTHSVMEKGSQPLWAGHGPEKVCKVWCCLMMIA